jgi:hypothetical protein
VRPCAGVILVTVIIGAFLLVLSVKGMLIRAFTEEPTINGTVVK